MDPVLQAFTGFMAENKGQDGIPHRTPTIINDMSTALYTQQALAAALYARRDLRTFTKAADRNAESPASRTRPCQ